jgi:MFS transporter, PPP family, 3-phenylpropionic acid transporter
VQRGLGSLRLYYFGSFAALGAYAPFFPGWLEARGVQGIAMGAVSALLPAMGVLGPPAVGMIADALGVRGSLLRIAGVGSGLTMAALGLLGARGVPLSFGLVFIVVFAFAAFRSPMVLLADVIAMERVSAAGTTYGKVRLWGSIGFLVAAFGLGHVLDPSAPAPLPFAIAALLGLASVAAWTLPKKPDGARLPVVREAGALARSRSFGLFLVASFLANLAHASHDLCLSLHLRDRGASAAVAGGAWAAGVLVEVALMISSERLITRFRAPRLVVFAIAGGAIRWALLASVGSLPVLLALQPLHAISFALWWVTSLAYIRDRAPPHALATAQGLFSAATALGSVVGMLAWGALYRRAGGSAVFASASIVGIVGVIVATFWSRRASPSDRGAVQK